MLNMSKKDKEELEQELVYLKFLLDFHNNARNTMWKEREKELKEYLDALLDKIIEIQNGKNVISKPSF